MLLDTSWIPARLFTQSTSAMKITLMDRSLYFKGLMLLIRKDRLVEAGERAMVMHVGALFSFEKGFCREVIDEILTNPHVVDEPPLFSHAEIARCFVQDGLKLSLADGQIHDKECEWLRAVVATNHLDESWYEDLRRDAFGQAGGDPAITLEAEHFVWE